MARIAVIDDRVTNRNVLARLASSLEEGVQVRAFASPCRALDWLAENAIDLLISDYKMPSLDGATLIRRFRELPHAADVPAVVVTVHEDRELRYAALEAGATDFLISPVDPIEFRARARNLLLARKQQRRSRQHVETLGCGGTAAGGSLGERRFQSVVEQLPIALSVVDRNGRFVYANPAFAAHLDEARDLTGRKLEDVLGEGLATRIGVINEKVFETERTIEPFEETFWHGSRGEITVLAAKAPLRDETGHTDAVVTCLLDVSGTSLDAATTSGLTARKEFTFRVQGAIDQARAANQRIAVHVLDLDRFKGINDAFGQEVGDRLLVEVALRLRNAVPASHEFARLSGDACALLQTGAAGTSDAQRYAERLLATFAAPFTIDGEEIHTGASIGTALFPDDADAADQLLANAEHAMYRAKASGRNTVSAFARTMTASARRAGRLEHELRQALAGDQFTVHYQPALDLRTGAFSSVEALLRWEHPERGLVSPASFIELAEGLGLIGRLSEQVLERACADQLVWRWRRLPPLRLSVNVAPMQLQQPGFADQVEAVLRASGFPPGELDIELTERFALEQTEHALREIDRLRRLGVSFSLDDFGTGYASLADVGRLPIQGLKIDRSFVSRLGQARADEAIVQAITDLGRRLGLRTTAEGVETAAQLNFVKALGCDEAQGQLISPPLAADDLEALLEERSLCRATG